MKKDINGWWDVPPGEKEWVCPNCGIKSPIELWSECEPYCSDCGSHDGRECPNCKSMFDHVWGSGDIKEANKAK